MADAADLVRRRRICGPAIPAFGVVHVQRSWARSPNRRSDFAGLSHAIMTPRGVLYQHRSNHRSADRHPRRETCGAIAAGTGKITSMANRRQLGLGLHRRSPVTTKSASRAPHSVQRNSLAQSNTGIQERCGRPGEQLRLGQATLSPNLTFVRESRLNHHQLGAGQNAVGNGGFSIGFCRRGLPHSSSSYRHLAKSAPNDTSCASIGRAPPIRRSSSGRRPGGTSTSSPERRTAPLRAVTVRTIPIAAFACVPRE